MALMLQIYRGATRNIAYLGDAGNSSYHNIPLPLPSLQNCQMKVMKLGALLPLLRNPLHNSSHQSRTYRENGRSAHLHRKHHPARIVTDASIFPGQVTTSLSALIVTASERVSKRISALSPPQKNYVK
jgi:hypothetical protein